MVRALLISILYKSAEVNLYYDKPSVMDRIVGGQTLSKEVREGVQPLMDIPSIR